MPSRRLDDRIQLLSDQIVCASNEELHVALPQLLAAIHEKLERLRSVAANRFVLGRAFAERRASRL
jgi:hypothetical protein